jgi:hypothetical protein
VTTAGEETTRSVGVLVEKPSPESQQYDSEIKPDRPMLDVVQITLDAFFQRGITAPPVDLVQPCRRSDQSRRHWGNFSPYTEFG